MTEFEQPPEDEPILDGEPTPIEAKGITGTPATGILNATADAIEEIDHAIEQLKTFQNRLKAEGNILAGRMVEYTDMAKRISESFAGFVEQNGDLIARTEKPKW